METFIKPEALNGHQLKKELKDAGIEIGFDGLGINEDGKLQFEITKGSKNKAKEIVEKHVGFENWIETSEAKIALLNKLGITEDEAKLLIG